MGAPAARVSELAHHWVNAGHDVTVLTGFPNHPDGVLRPEYRKPFLKGVHRERSHGVKVVRTWLLPFPNRKTHERALNYSSFCTSAAITGSFLDKPEVVIATSPQLLVGLAGWWIAKLNNVPFILEIRDLWPESLAAVGVGKPDSMLHRALSRLAGFLYGKAHQIVIVSAGFRERLVRHWRVPNEKISLVPNGVETQLFSPQAHDHELTKSLNGEGKFVVSYIGTLGMAHGLETVIAAAERLQHCTPEILFLIVGDGAERERIVALATSKGLANVRFISQQAREKIPAYICASDACLVTLKKSEIFETVVPSKMLEFMSSGRPVILAVDGHARSIIESSGAGIYVPPENPDALVEAIMQLQRQPALREFMGRNGREYIVRHLSRQRTAIEYEDVLNAVVRGKTLVVEGTAA
jgi:glycosyltransferase involved in cell wall biosynthesis